MQRLIGIRHRFLLNLQDDVALLYPAVSRRTGRINRGNHHAALRYRRELQPHHPRRQLADQVRLSFRPCLNFNVDHPLHAATPDSQRSIAADQRACRFPRQVTWVQDGLPVERQNVTPGPQRSNQSIGMPATISSTGNLGQTMVQSFCNQIGALLDFRTVPGRGTIVSIRLPLPPDGTPRAGTSAGQGAQTSHSVQPRPKDETIQQGTAGSETQQTTLFDPVRLGPLILANRIVVAPLTRSRASRDGVPSPLAADYYAQCASAGVIIAEATNISPRHAATRGPPGIYSDPRRRHGAE
jgi:hypothetical protein